MNIPSLPTDNLYKFFFVTGLILMVGSLYMLTTFFQDYEKEYANLNGEIKKDSIILSYLSDKISDLEKDSIFKNSIAQKYQLKSITSKTSNLDEKIELIEKQLLEREIKRNDIKTKSEILNNLELDLKFYLPIFRIALFVGLIIFFYGGYMWSEFQVLSDSIIYNEYCKSTPAYKICQSCGMDLQYDENKKSSLKYCSFCYSENGFNHPNMSLKEFNLLVKNRMKELNFSWFDRLFCSKLNNLARWKKVFKWV